MTPPRAALLAILAAGLVAQDAPMELGPAPTREMFPLYLATLGYRPVDPTPLGTGRWRFELGYARANVFEFSYVLKERGPKDAAGRVLITREYVEAHAADYADIPLLFYFDEEIERTEFRARVGLSDATDAWVELPVQSQGGGHLDRLIEGFHSLGFEQFGRDQVARDQITLLVMEYGKVAFFSQQHLNHQAMDPSLGLVHRLVDRNGLRLSATFSLKLPMVSFYREYKGGWDHSLGLSARWEASPRHILYAGAGLVRRPHGNAAYNRIQGSGFRHGGGAHLGWEWRPGGAWRPFLQLLWQDGYLPHKPYQRLHQDSLQHDLGVHWQVHPKAVLTFRYVNNVTHHENTADMSLVAGLNVRL